jgi:Domain of unknown function (DUF4845)
MKIYKYKYNNNKGISILSILMSLVLVLSFVVPVARIVPSYMEYLSIKKTIERAANITTSAAEARSMIEKQFIVDNMRSISTESIDIQDVNGKVNISLSYKQPIPLYANLSLLMEYDINTSSSKSMIPS